MAEKKKKTGKTREEEKKKAEENANGNRLQVKVFCGGIVCVEKKVNSWLKEGEEKEILWFDYGVYILKSSFSSGGEEKELCCVFHYKFVNSS